MRLDSLPGPPQDDVMQEDARRAMLVLLAACGGPDQLAARVLLETSNWLASTHLLGQMIEEGAIDLPRTFKGPASEASAELLSKVREWTEVLTDG